MDAFHTNATIGPDGELELKDLPYASGQAVRVSIESATVQKNDTPRLFDIHPGAVSMSDDFDEPLPEAFWLGNEPTDETACC